MTIMIIHILYDKLQFIKLKTKTRKNVLLSVTSNFHVPVAVSPQHRTVLNVHSLKPSVLLETYA